MPAAASRKLKGTSKTARPRRNAQTTNSPGVNVKLNLSKNKFQGSVNDIARDIIAIGSVDGDVYLQPKIDRVALANWVSDLDFSQNQSQAFERYTPGTLRWVMDSPELWTWFKSTGGILWCSGKPGAGKTVFAAFIIDKLLKMGEHDPETVAAVCHVYCRYDATRTTLQLFEAILSQLIRRCPAADLARILAAKERSLRLTLPDILSILQILFNAIPNIFIIIDAFDECFSEQTRHQVLERLQSLTSVKILITSRPLPSIESAMKGFARLIILAHDEDVKTFFRSETRSNPALEKLIPMIAETDVEGQIIEKADGMFLLAQLHVTNLAAQTNTAELIRALETLPKEAAATYDETLKRIRQQPPNKKRLAFHTLSWVSHTWRPLQMVELRYALALGRLDSARVPEVNDLDDEETILSSCAGLIVVNGLYSTVGFLHYTVQEFIQEVGTSSDFLSEVAIATICLKVMLLPVESRSPFHQYVISAWGSLVRRCEHDDTVFNLALAQMGNRAIVETLAASFHLSHQVLSAPPLSFASPYSDSDSDMPHPHGRTAMHLVAFYGLVRTGAALIRTQSDPAVLDGKDRKGHTALIWAARNGHREVVKLLLDTQLVDLNSQDSTGRTALCWAAANGYSSVINVLISRPNIAVNLRDIQGRTTLDWAVANQHQQAVKELFSNPNLDVTAGDRRSGETPLSWAVENGHSELVQAILTHPMFNVNARDRTYGRSPMSWAACRGHVELVKKFISQPQIQVNAGDELGMTPLSSAAQEGHLEVVKLLLAYPSVDVNSRDREYGRSPLSWAVWNGHLEIVKVLLPHPDLDVNSSDIPYGHTPFSYAAEKGLLELMTLLLAHPHLDINCKDSKFGQTPLSWAAERGHAEVVRLLLQIPNIKCNERDLLGGTPFSWAAANSHHKVVSLLLDANVDVNERDPEDGQTPLLWAVKRRDFKAVNVLLTIPNIDVNVRDCFGNTPLLAAAGNGDLDIVNSLLSVPGIDLHSLARNGITPLLRAAARGRLEVVKLLLSFPDGDSERLDHVTKLLQATDKDNLAVVKVVLSNPGLYVIYPPPSESNDDAGWRILRSWVAETLSWAAETGNLEIVKLLLEIPNIDVNSTDDRGRTPLSLAVKEGQLAVVSELLNAQNVDVDTADKDGQTPLSWAVFLDRLDIVRALIDSGKIDVDAKGNQRILSHAVRSGQVYVLELLLKLERTEACDDPLRFAAAQGNIEVVKLLLDTQRPDVNTRCEECGSTALHSAAIHGHLDVVKFLLETTNADINVLDKKYGATPLLCAAEMGHLDIVNFLLDTGRIALPGTRLPSATGRQLSSRADSPRREKLTASKSGTLRRAHSPFLPFTTGQAQSLRSIFWFD